MRAATSDASAIIAMSLILRQPALVREMREAPLPPGMIFLLEVAVGDTAALSAASRMTGEAPHVLIDAAGFFVEQVLLTERADHYRVLGAAQDASAADLRRHMALLMRWLHPDAGAARPPGHIDRSVFATRIATAWQTLKAVDRRAAYDAALHAAKGHHARNATGKRHGNRRSGHGPRLSVHLMTGEGLIGRLLLFLRGGR